jgi:hypothetical protein
MCIMSLLAIRDRSHDLFECTCPDLVLVDTAKGGRPDMTALTVENYRSFGADAVFVGSNPEGTRQIVSGCPALGIPAFGPSWDS